MFIYFENKILMELKDPFVGVVATSNREIPENEEKTVVKERWWWKQRFLKLVLKLTITKLVIK